MKTKMVIMVLVGASMIQMKSFANPDTTLVDPVHNDTTITFQPNLDLREEIAEFPGGDTAMQTYFHQEIRYPAQARMEGIEGKVVVSFVITENGKPENIEVIQGIGGNCEDEIIRAIDQMPVWKPSIQAGHAIRTRKVLGFNFEL